MTLSSPPPFSVPAELLKDPKLAAFYNQLTRAFYQVWYNQIGYTISPAAATVLDDATVADMRETLGVEIGTDVQAWDATLEAISAHDTDGLLVQIDTDTFTGRTLAGTASEVDVTNGDGVSGDPIVSLPAALTFTGKTVTGGTFSEGKYAGRINFRKGTNVTISSGEVTLVESTASFYQVDTESSDATDDLDTITDTNAADGDVIVICPVDSARTVVAKNGTGNLVLAGDFTMDNAADRLTLIYLGAAWNELSRSDNGA